MGSKIAVGALAVIGGLVVVALLVDFLAPAGPTVIADNQRFDVPSGASTGAGFELFERAKAEYSVLVRTATGMDVCLLPESESQFWVEGKSVTALACHEETFQVTNSVILEPGSYLLGFRCPDTGSSCTLSYSLRLMAME